MSKRIRVRHRKRKLGEIVIAIEDGERYKIVAKKLAGYCLENLETGREIWRRRNQVRDLTFKEVFDQMEEQKCMNLK